MERQRSLRGRGSMLAVISTLALIPLLAACGGTSSKDKTSTAGVSTGVAAAQSAVTGTGTAAVRSGSPGAASAASNAGTAIAGTTGAGTSTSGTSASGS